LAERGGQRQWGTHQCIANVNKVTGPVPVENPRDAFADDQLGLMDHLGIREFFDMGFYIGRLDGACNTSAIER
jgi:hypothetical protein